MSITIEIRYLEIPRMQEKDGFIGLSNYLID
jgi:hypothetical protein